MNHLLQALFFVILTWVKVRVTSGAPTLVRHRVPHEVKGDVWQRQFPRRPRIETDVFERKS